MSVNEVCVIPEKLEEQCSPSSVRCIAWDYATFMTFLNT